ncbi:MAG: radical SAM protein [Bacillota bacterium]
MKYNLPLWRPPSEADSLILQVTIGCAHNRCAFCCMYKGKQFSVKTWEEIEEDLAEAKATVPGVGRIFLADGDALAADTELLLRLLDRLYRDFPHLQRVSVYGGPKDILAKKPEELVALKEHGLGMIYMGIESGSDRILQLMGKGVSAEEMVLAGRKGVNAGIDLSVTVISGLGGREHWEEHASETARVLNAIAPQYLGLLTLMVKPGTPLDHWIREGRFSLLDPLETALETRLLLASLSLTGCVFRSNHASNYLALKGTLSQDREALLALLDQVLREKDQGYFRPERYRGL